MLAMGRRIAVPSAVTCQMQVVPRKPCVSPRPRLEPETLSERRTPPSGANAGLDTEGGGGGVVDLGRTQSMHATPSREGAVVIFRV